MLKVKEIAKKKNTPKKNLDKPAPNNPGNGEHMPKNKI